MARFKGPETYAEIRELVEIRDALMYWYYYALRHDARVGVATGYADACYVVGKLVQELS